MRGFYLLLFLALVVNITALGQNAGDYRSATSGPWNQAGTWETFDGLSWNAAVAPPTNTAGAINITAFTAVDVTTAVTADEIVIEGDGVLNVQSGGNLTVVAGGLTVTEGDGFFTTDGFLNVLTGGTVTGSAGGVITSTSVNMLVDGTYTHAINGGTLPTASWNDGSLLQVTGTTNNSPTGNFTGQSFYDVTFNFNSTALVAMSGGLTDVRHNLTIANTGTAAAAGLSLTGGPGSTFGALTIGNDLTISGNSALAFAPTTGGAAYSISIGGNLVISSSKATLGLNVAGSNSNVSIVVQGNFTKSGVSNASLVNAAATTQASTVNIEINGNMTWGSGTLTMANGSNAGNLGTVGSLNIGGDLTINGGSFTKAGTIGTVKGSIVFDDSHTHTFTSAVATPFSSLIDFTVPATNRLNIEASSALTGTGAFNLAAGATLGISSQQGITTGTTQGAIRTTAATRAYAVNSNIIYNGTSLQSLGNEWASGGKLNGVAVNLEINNSAGVINNPSSTNIVGSLTLTNGSFDINAGTTFSILGNFTNVSGSIKGYNNSNVTFGGSGTVTGNLTFTPGFQILNNFTISRNTTVLLGSDLTINQTGVLAFSGSGNLRINGNTLTVNGDITQSGAGAIASSVNTSNLVIGGSGALTALPLCTSCGSNVFNNVTLDRSSGATYTWNSAATVSGTFALNSGAFTHSSGLIMGTGSTFSRSAGTTVAGVAPNATTTYNVSYNGNLTTSLELPTVASNALNNLTVAGNVTIDKNIRILGDVSITSGTLDANTRAVNMQGATFAVNGGSYTISSATVTTFSRAGTTALTGSTIGGSTFGGITINNGTTINAPNANINISGVWTNNGTFTANNGTVTFNGASQNIDANGQPFWNLIADTGTKTLTNNLDVNGTFNITTGTVFNGSSFNILIADTWDNKGTFNAQTGTVVFDGNAQSIDGSNTSFHNVTMATGGTKTLTNALDVDAALTINSGVTLDASPTNYTINVGGGWANNGTFAARNGTVIFDGGIIQSVSGSSTNSPFYNLTQTGGSGTMITMNSAQSLTNALSLLSGTFNPNGNFTMLSSAAGDARINELQGGASIAATNMTVQRYLPNTAGSRNYRYLSSPVTNATVNEWKDDFPITGPFPGHSVQAEWPSIPNINATNQSMYRYNEAHTPTSVYTDRYEAYPAAAQNITAAPLTNGIGYAAFVRQAAPIVIEVVGQAATGQRNVTVTNQAGGANDGWNLIGNPYPSPISWQNVTIPAGVGAYIGLKDNTNNIGLGAGQYVYYTQGGFGIPGSYTGTIAQGQAFWVRKTTAGPTVISFQEDDKLPTSTPPFMRASFEDVLRMHVAGNQSADELIIHFDTNAKDASDDQDAYKLGNDYINFYSLATDGSELAINTFGALACSREIPLVLKGTAKGPYAITFSELESFSEGVDIRLLDSYTGQTYVVSDENNLYNFQINDDAGSQNANRFKVYIGYKDLNLGLPVQSSDVCIGNDAQVKIMTPQVGVTYQATIDGNAVGQPMIATDATQLTLTIPNANLAATNTIVLKAKNKGCAEMPLAQSVTVKTQGLPTVSLAKGATGCGESAVTLNAEGAPEGGSYKWYLAEDATDAIDGQTASSYVTPSLTKTKTYFVSAVNSLGCEGARVAITATIAYPLEAQITVDGLNLVSNSDTGNQWYVNGNKIAGATGKTYMPKESGTYKLSVTTGDCTTSIEKEFTVTGDVDIETLKGYVMYPNPTPGVVYVEVATSSEVAVKITTQIGVEIANGALKQEGRKRKGQFDISGHASGVYLVIIKHDNQTVVKKIVKN